MKHALIALLLVATTCPSFAREHATYEPQCKPLTEIKAKNKEAKFTPLSVGQYHFALGFYVGSPITPDGAPPGNGAMLVEAAGHAAILWMRGAEACVTVIALGQGHGDYMPMPITAPQLAMLKAVRTGKLEEVPPSDADTKDELHL